MAFLAIIAGLVIAVLAISVFIAYWLIMAMLVAIGVVFVLWVLMFTSIFNADPGVAYLCAFVATGLTIWAIGALNQKQKRSKESS
jgi:hypothetical protein